MTSIFAGKTPLIVLISLLTATPLAAQTVLEKAARDETPVWPIPIPPWRPPCARRNRRWRIFSKSPQRQGRARRASLSKLPFAKVSASNIFGLRLLPITAPSFPARSIIRRAWFTLKLGQTITFAQSDIVRLALYRERDDARQLHCLRAPHIGAEKRSGRVQENLRTQLRFLKKDYATR